MKTNSLFKRLVSMLIVVLMICTVFPVTALAANSTVVLHPSVNHTVTGVKVKVGDTINGYEVTKIGGSYGDPYDITVDLGKYKVNNDSFKLPYAKDIWEGVDNNKVDYISWAGGGSNRRSEGASALLVNGKNTAYYYFKGVPSTTYSIKYNTQGGSTVASTTTSSTAESATLNVTSTKPTKEGYTFLGWAESAGATVANAKSSYTLYRSNPTMTLYAVWQKETPAKPADPTLTELNALLEVEIDCEKHDDKDYDLYQDHYTITGPTLIDGEWKCDVTVDSNYYIGLYNTSTGKTHTLKTSETVTLVYDNGWELDDGEDDDIELKVECDGAPTPPAGPQAPEGSYVEALFGEQNPAVKIHCVNTEVSHEDKTYPLIPNSEGVTSYSIGEVSGNATDGYTCVITVYPAPYVSAYNTATGVTHTLDPNTQTSATITLKYYGTSWQIDGEPATFTVKCDTPATQVPVEIRVYRNGDTTTPYYTKTLKVNKGSTFKVGDLDINDYYSSSNGFEFEGWYNDGGWNYYKAGNKDNKLPDEITVSGWTNIYCMVTDYENVVVKAVTDDDKVNAETIFTGKALHGSNLIDFLNSDVSVSEKTGYTLDKWFNWDWYGHKFDNTSVVNGWTNVYVTYTSKPYTVIAKLYIDGEPAYYQATDFYTTSITGKYGETINYKAIKDWAEAKAKELKAGSSATIFEATIYKDGGTFAPEKTFGQFNPDIFTTYVWVDVTTKANTKPLDPVVYYYEVRHLQEQLDGSFKLVDTDRAFAQKGTEVTAVLKDYPNYTPAPAVSGTVIEVTVNNDGTPNYLILEQKYYLNTYSVTYTDGVGGKVFKDDVHTVKSGATTPAFVGGIPTRPGYVFVGWTPAVSKTVTGNATYTATWRKVKDTTVIEIGGGNSSSSSKEENPNTGAPVFVGVSVGALAAAK